MSITFGNIVRRRPQRVAGQIRSRRETALRRKELAARQRCDAQIAELGRVQDVLGEVGDVVRVCRTGLVEALALAAQAPVADRSVDLLWHTLVGDAPDAVRRRPSPRERVTRVSGLARWEAGRSPQDVVRLLAAADAAAGAERTRLLHT